MHTVCRTKFQIYIPYNLVACPRVLVVCRSPHSHPDPAPIKTPPTILHVFRELLLALDWKLADATPRRIYLDSGFIQGLRRHLDWKSERDPCLSDLHPSLGNLDHVYRQINKLRSERFPAGTGFEGMLPTYYMTVTTQLTWL